RCGPAGTWRSFLVPLSRTRPGFGPERFPEPSFLFLLLSGCELTASTKSYTFQVDEDDDSDHVLALSVVCLTDGAKDECNVVEVIGRNHKNQEISVPVANLKLSCQPLLSLDNFKLQPPVTFRLAAGSGPVHLAGWHQICKGSYLGNGLGGVRGHVPVCVPAREPVGATPGASQHVCSVLVPQSPLLVSDPPVCVPVHRDDASFEEFDDDDMSEEEMAPIVPAKKERRKQ
uniref:Nucleophosmin/nucleoplasmin 3 n=1 Tax=Coturnix japonica TaxID=93934 RepID=A0A8C2UDC3_COTJA